MTTTAQGFTAFLETISPTDSQRQDITAKRQSTEKYLREAFPQSGTMPLKRVILIGSADRGTIVRPVNDVDVMAEFTNKDDVFEQYRRDSGANSCWPPAIPRALRSDGRAGHGAFSKSPSPVVDLARF